MLELSPNTKKAQTLLNNYEHAFNKYGSRSLSECYVKPSYEKQEAYRHCLKIMLDNNGFKGTITGHSCDYFSFAFIYPDKNTGVLRLAYITYAHTYTFDI